jgi:uncharacterized membrane protein YvlD (DUF360 family)
MKRYLMMAATYLGANAVAMLLAALILGPGFEVSFTSFVMAVALFTVVQAVAKPILEKLAAKRLPQIMGSLSLIVVFLGLWVTDIFTAGMTIDGISNWLAATLIIWLSSLIVEIALPYFVFPSMRQPKT